MPEVTIEQVATGDDAAVAGVAAELAEVLLDCVHGGSSVGFLADLTLAGATAWWAGALRAPDTITWVARPTGPPAGPAVGVVQLKPAPMANGAHRADVNKLLVHRSARGRGVAAALMAVLEAEALRRGRWLLLLDTETGSTAERLYLRWGWQQLGVLPDHAAGPDGTLAPTTFFAKRLSPVPG